jgi:hypothetical protein
MYALRLQSKQAAIGSAWPTLVPKIGSGIPSLPLTTGRSSVMLSPGPQRPSRGRLARTGGTDTRSLEGIVLWNVIGNGPLQSIMSQSCHSTWRYSSYSKVVLLALQTLLSNTCVLPYICLAGVNLSRLTGIKPDSTGYYVFMASPSWAEAPNKRPLTDTISAFNLTACSSLLSP